MEKTQLFPWILLLVSATCHLCRGDAWKNGDDVIILSMMNHSAAYIYTHSEETDTLAIEYLAKEREMTGTLDKAWRKASSLRKNDPRLSKAPVPRGLREEHVVAIIAYTLPSQLYKQFNAAMRMYGASDSVYAEKFPFKAFQYLLSVVIARLREDQGETPQPTYRGMQQESIGEEGSRMKFGQFASSSRTRPTKFGTKTMFTILSQYGAQIQNYSFYDHEEEVLIPPYEAFKIMSYQRRRGGVDISLKTDGEAGIPVRVRRGSGGQMIVRRCVETAFSAVERLSILRLLAQSSL